MANDIAIRKVRPWHGVRGMVRTSANYVPLSDTIPPATPGRRAMVYDLDGPDWRWQETDKIFQRISNPADYTPGRNSDPLIATRLLSFVWHLKTATDTFKGEDRAREEYPDQWWALRVYLEEPIVGHFLQAAALANAPVEEIADKLGVAAEQVWWYERMFFDVRHKLDKEVWITLKVLYPSIQRMGPLHVSDFLWKALGWCKALGWEHLLNIINPMGSTTPEARARALDMLDRKILEDTLMAVFSRIPNRYNENFIMDQYLKILEIEKGGGRTPGEIQRDNNLTALMQTVQQSFHMASVETNFNGVETRAHVDLVKIYAERARLAAETERTKVGELT